MIKDENLNSGINIQLNEWVIVRTYSAGVWFGKLTEKYNDEIILSEARRMWHWKCKKSISLSGCALYGIDQNESKICPPVEKVWLVAIEIISLTKESYDSIKGSKHVEAE